MKNTQLILLSSLVYLTVAATSSGNFKDTKEITPGGQNSSLGEVLRSAVAKRASRSGRYTHEVEMKLLEAHNYYRTKTGASNMVKLEWDSDLAKEAQRWADRCDFNHPKERRQVGRFQSIGQNLYASTNIPDEVSSPVKSWYDEIEDYTYSPNFQCRPNKQCGHYTQVVWATTEAVGCAIRYCERLTSAAGIPKGAFVVCEYGPAGNYRGRYPYKKGAVCSACDKDKYKFCARGLCSTTSGSQASARFHLLSAVGLLATRICMAMVVVTLLGITV